MLLARFYLDAAAQFLDEASERWVHGSRLRDLLIELYPGANAGVHDDDILRELVEAGKLVHTERAEPNHSQRAFLGLQFSTKSLHDQGFAAGLRSAFSYRAVDSFVITDAMRAACHKSG